MIHFGAPTTVRGCLWLLVRLLWLRLCLVFRRKPVSTSDRVRR